MILKRILPNCREVLFNDFSNNDDDTEKKISVKVNLPSNLFYVDKGAFFLNGSIVQITIHKNELNETYCKLDDIASSRWECFVPYPLITRGQVFILKDNTWIDALDFPEMEQIVKNWEDYKKNKANAWNERIHQLSEYGFCDEDITTLRRSMSIQEVDDILRVFEELRRKKPKQRKICNIMKFYSKIHFENVLRIKIKYLKTAKVAIMQYAKENNYTINIYS